MMIQPSLTTIRAQHQALLGKSAEMKEDDIPQVEAFVESVAKAGAYIGDTDQRSFLLALIRYWVGFLQDKTSHISDVRLQPFDVSLRVRVFGKSYVRELIENPRFDSIDTDTRLKNPARGFWVYDELLNALASNGWVRFAPGFKSALYGKKGCKWCIKVLGMGVGEDPLYFCERGYYLAHERSMLQTFQKKGFTFQPDVKSQEETIEFLVSEACGVSLQQATLRALHNDVLVTQYIGGIPFATQTGYNVDFVINISRMEEGVLREMYTPLTVLKEHLCKANSEGLLHNDVMPPNILFTLDEDDKIVAKLVDFETAQDLNAQSPDFVGNTVRELYLERRVPMDTGGVPMKTLDQHLIDEDIAILDKLIQTASTRSQVSELFPDARFPLPYLDEAETFL